MTGEAASPAPPGSAPTVDDENPWPGLAAFREDDRAYFRGRGAETEELHLRVKLERLTVVFGKSGLGKTSLLLAGLFPLLRQEHVLPVYLRLDLSAGGPDLCAQVKEAILRQAAAAAVEAPSAREGETLWEYFHRQDADFWDRRNRPVVPLLVFDQFEEIFTLGRERADTAELIDALGELVEGHPPATVKARLDADPKAARELTFGRHEYKVLLSLREDFLPDLEGLRGRIRSIVDNRLRLEAMSGEAAFAVVTGPRELITDEVADRVIRFVAAARDENAPRRDLVVEPALLSVVCRELNTRRLARGEARISAADLERDQDEILSGLYERNLRDVAPEMRGFVEEKLVTVDGYRNTVALEDALSHAGVTRGDVDLLVDRRLLRIEPRRGLSWLELTHDLLTGVVVASRDARRRQEAGERAEAARRQAEERERKARRELRRTRLTLAVLVVLLSVAAVAIAWALRERDEAERQAGIADHESANAREQQRLADAAAIEANKQTRIAELKEQEALDAQGRAEQSARAAERARLEALDLREIAVVRQLAAEAETQMGREGARPQLGALLAVESVQRRPTLEGDQVLRRALTLHPPRLFDAGFELPDAGPCATAPYVAAFSPDGYRLALSGGRGEVRILDVATGAETASWTPGDRSCVTGIAFSLDSLQLAAATARGVSVWRDWDSSHPRRDAVIETGKPAAFTLSPYGDLVAFEGDRGVEVWDLSPKRRGTLQTELTAMPVQDLAFSPDGFKLAVAGAYGSAGGHHQGEIDIWTGWDRETPERSVLTGGLSFWSSVLFDLEGEHLAAELAGSYGGNTVEVWNLASRRRIGTLPGSLGSDSADGWLLSTVHEDRIRFWEGWTSDGPREAGQVPLDGDLLAADFDPDGEFLLLERQRSDGGPAKARIHAWRPPARQEVLTIDFGHRVEVVAPSPDGGLLATVDAAGTAEIWDVHAADRLGPPLEGVRDVAFTPEGEFLAARIEGGCVRVLRGRKAKGFEELTCLESESEGKLLGLAFGPDGKLLAVRTHRGTDIWDLEAPRKLVTFAAARQVALGPKGSHALVVDRGKPRLWDFTRRAWTTSPDFGAGTVTLGPRGSRLAVATGSSVRVLDLDGSPPRDLHLEDLALRSVAFSPDERYLATAGASSAPAGALVHWSLPTTVQIWEIDEGRLVAKVPLDGAVDDVAFSSDGRYFATAGYDGTVRVWLWRPADLIAETCRRLGRNLSRQEWRQYLGEGEPYRKTCPGLPIPED